MSKLLFIYNPCSGRGKIKSHLSDVVDIFTKNGYEVTVYPTQSQGDCTRRAAAAAQEDFDRIIAAGGDGMMHELMVAAVGSKMKTVVGYIPTGTVNDFAASNHIPRNINAAAENAVQGTAAYIDAASFNQTYFSYVAAFGLITQVSYSTDQRAKNFMGGLAYFFEAMKSLDSEHISEASNFLDITADERKFSGEFIFGAVTNSTSIGSMKNFFPPDVKLDDGILEGIFIKRPKNIIELDNIRKGLMNKKLDADCIVSVRAADFLIKSEKQMAWTLDGENGGVHENVSIRAIPQAIRIALPAL